MPITQRRKQVDDFIVQIMYRSKPAFFIKYHFLFLLGHGIFFAFLYITFYSRDQNSDIHVNCKINISSRGIQQCFFAVTSTL